MFPSKLKRVAESVGLVCFVLLALYGAFSIVRGEAAWAASKPNAQAAPASSNAAVPLVLNHLGTLRDTAGNSLNGTNTMTSRVLHLARYRQSRS